MDCSTYQTEASKTIKFSLGGPQSAIAPLLGLANEAGSILNVYKKYLMGRLQPADEREFLEEELGDLLWYAAATATACSLDLERIAQKNLRKTADLYTASDAAKFASLPVLDDAYQPEERFPRKLTVEFTERHSGDSVFAVLKLVDAQPNAFPDGPFERDGKRIGFKLGDQLGA